MSRIRTIEDVAERHLCSGCGVCAYLDVGIRMVDDPEAGRRPEGATGTSSAEALSACPGAALAHDQIPFSVAEPVDAWGPVLEVWEGYAADPEIRFAGSSGGATTALALHCIETEGMHGALHISARDDVPYLNRTTMSTDRAGLLAATGSRYAPASPCDGLGEIEAAPGPCVFIGKPCDVAATARAARIRPALEERIGLTIGFFCAGTPSLRGTLEMLNVMGVDPAELTGLRYRGRGWPGLAEASTADGSRSLTYDESWNEILQKHRQWRCHVCVDHTGEFADIAVGDPWYREADGQDPGRSLIVVRTERGRRVLRAAAAAGAIVLEKNDATMLERSQPNLLRNRGALFGRLVALRFLGPIGVAAPRYGSMPTFRSWRRDLTAKQKVQSVLGTVKRVFSKRLHRRVAVREIDLGRGDGRRDP